MTCGVPHVSLFDKLGVSTRVLLSCTFTAGTFTTNLLEHAFPLTCPTSPLGDWITLNLDKSTRHEAKMTTYMKWISNISNNKIVIWNTVSGKFQ